LLNGYPRELVEIIVVDNGSTDDSRNVALRRGATVLHLPNLRVSALRNAAARKASGQIIAFIDADHEIDPGWLERAADLLKEPAIVGAGATCRPPPAGTWVQRHYDALRGPTTGRSTTEWLGSGNLAVSRDAFEKAGGFDETLETCEDVDLCQRLRAQGGTLIADEALKSVHFGDPDTLGALFRGELWRGRDNLRVSLRGPLSFRALPSLLIPLIDIGLLISIPIAIAVGAGRVVAVAAGGFMALAALRSMKIMSNLTSRTPADILRALVVAATYDFARAAAIVTRGSHSRRRRAAAA
jgi:glycosyltransferase involved in cell wall biosynthesis